MTLKIRFGIDVEKHVLKQVISRLDFYDSNKYKPHFPEGFHPKKDSFDKAEKLIEKEFDKQKYGAIAESLLKSYKRIEPELKKSAFAVLGKDLPDFEVSLVSYGMVGSYWPPNKIFLNISAKNISLQLIHEIIHLLIQPMVITYALTQLEKERTVDLIMNLPQFNFWNKEYLRKDIAAKVPYLDGIFKKHFLNSPEEYFKQIEKARL